MTANVCSTACDQRVEPVRHVERGGHWLAPITCNSARPPHPPAQQRWRHPVKVPFPKTQQANLTAFSPHHSFGAEAEARKQ